MPAKPQHLAPSSPQKVRIMVGISCGFNAELSHMTKLVVPKGKRGVEGDRNGGQGGYRPLSVFSASRGSGESDVSSSLPFLNH